MSLVAPVLSQITYNGSLIRANFTYDHDEHKDFQIGLFENGGSTPTQTAVSFSGPGVITLTSPQMNLTSVWTVKVAATEGVNVGPYSNPLAVIVATPESITVTMQSDAAIAITWAPPKGATVVYGATLSLFNATTNELLGNASYTSTPALFRPAGGFNPAINYGIRLAGMTGNNSYGPYSTLVNIIQTTPAFSDLDYSATTDSASITANSSSFDPNNLLALYLYADGALVRSKIAPVAGGVVQMSLDDPLDPSFTWTANLAYTANSGASRGPLSAPLSVLVEPATISSVAYDGTTVTASWNNGVGAPPPTGAYVQVRDANLQTVAYGDTLGTVVSIVPDPVLTANTPYTLIANVQRGASLGTASDPVNVLTYLTTPTAVSYDGATITVTWPTISGTGVTGVNIALLNAGTIVQTQPSTGTTITIPTALSPSGTYDIALQTTGDRTSGPIGTSVPIITVMPRVTGATYTTSGTTGSVVVKWNASDVKNGHGVSGYSVQLWENGAPFGSAVAISNSATDTTTITLQNPLASSKSYAVTVQATGAKGTGPMPSLAPVLTAAPQFLSIAYDGANVTASWLATGQDGVVGYRVSAGATNHDTSLTTITFAHSGGSANPTISVLALGAAATGPASSTTLLTTKATVDSTSYDGALLKTTWTAATGAGAYVLEVREGTSVIATQTTNELSATLPIALSASATYSVAVRSASADGVVIGPRSTAAAVIVATPTISNVKYDGTNITGNVTAPTGVTLDPATLKVALYANGIPAGTPVTATGGSFTIAVSNAGAGLTVRAQLSGEKDNVSVAAPYSPPVPVLTAQPLLESALLTADGTTWTLNAAWSLPESDPTVGVFTVKLKQEATVIDTWTVSGTTISKTTSAIDTGKNVHLTITPKGNFGEGPASAAAYFIPTSITATSSVVDNNRITVTWTVAPSASFTAYRLRLVQAVNDGWLTIAEGESISGTTGSIDIPSSLINTDATYGVTVDAAKDVAWTASNRVDDIVLQPPAITSSASASASSVAIAWDAPPAPSDVSGWIPVMTWESGELALTALDATPLHATLAIDSTVPSGAWITLRAIKGQSTGPASSSVAFVVGVPAGLSVAYDGTNVSASWDAASDPRVSAYQVTFKVKDQAPVIETVTTNSWSKAFTPSTGQTATVEVLQVAGFSNGPATSPLDTILGTPAITKAQFDGAQMSLEWSAVTDSAATAYAIEVLSGGAVAVTFTSGGTKATIPFAASADTLRIRAIGASTSGPLAPSFTPLTATPNVTSIAFDSASGSLTIEWDTISGAAKYKVEFRLANDVVLHKDNTTNSLTLTKAELPASAIYDITVQAFANANNDHVSGPISAPLPAVIVPPPNVHVAYDGRNARVAWEPIASPSIAAYIVTILDGANVVTSQTVAGSPATIAVAYASTNDYDVVVQAITSAGAGQPSSKDKLFQQGWYPSVATDETSYIQPAKDASMASYDIEVYLANLFTTYQSSGLPSVPPFEITTADAPFSYKLKMAKDSAVWTFGADVIRSDIVTAYATLLADLINLNVTPLGWRMVQDAISRAMPQTFAETLFYGYAFSPGDGYVDLKPGMLLRADFESYQYLGPDQTVSEYVDGFVTSSSAIYDVGSYVSSNNQWLTGFDSFLSLVTQSGSTVPPPASEGSTSSGGGGIVDLYYSQFRKSFVRLVYPPQLLGDRNSDARTAFNVAVLASNDYPTLVTATTNLRNAQPLPNGVAATYLRGRTMISACIRIWLDSQPLVVSVGTTVGNVLENMGRRPPIVIPQSGSPGIPLSGLTLERSIGYAITDPADATAGYPVSKGVAIRLDWNQGMAYSTLTDWLSLPLLPGDRIITRGDE